MASRQAEVAMPAAITAWTNSLYDAHPSLAMVQKWLAALKEETGRSMKEWIALVKEEGPRDEKSRSEWLKTKEEMGTNRASEGEGSTAGTGWVVDDAGSK